MKNAIFSFLLLTSSQAFAADGPATETKPALPATDAKAKEDCDGKDQVAKELDTKKVEVKAAEDKALQNLGLLADAKPKVDPTLVPVTKMETCK
ncbi:MAG: hypothetical protein EOP04_33405 [Proteobacteria bacterium]|nr:MAG: hypothetical protein EOP04_33405 [Pseudomonadota bacterium]